MALTHTRSVSLFKEDGSPAVEEVKSSSGMAHVSTAPGGLARIRQVAALDGTAVTLTWDAPGILALKLVIVSEAAGTAELPAAAAFCIDPPSAATRDAWLTAGDSISADSQMLVAFADKENDTLVFSTPVTTVGLKRLWGSQALTVVAVGVEVAS